MANASGLLFIVSHVRDPDKTPDELYNRWLDEEVIPKVLNSGHVKLALRYKNVDPSAEIPYVALYPVDDWTFMGSPDMRKLDEKCKSSSMLQTDDVFELIHFEMKPFEKIQTHEGYHHQNDPGHERGKSLLCVQMEPGEGQEEELDDWYRRHHLDVISMCQGYRRSTRYKRKDGVIPRYLALHEFDCEADELPTKQLMQVCATTWTRRIKKGTKLLIRDVFTLVQAHGDTDMKL
ncbi:hypothetical protein F5Y16DRAFT_118793 [Xylariaceae sp. FL0255]|nr:hypothetical protein F5Y16DRAFT_118793 [Xylariaceae sp. FL0255]